MKKLVIFILILIFIINVYLIIYKCVDKPVQIIDEIKEEKIIKPVIYDEYKIGDIIKIKDEEWRVIKDSNKDEDYLTLINLNYSRKIKNCNNKYINLKEKNYFEGEYSNSLGDNILKEVDGYKIRLITLDEYKNLVTLSKKEIDDTAYNYTVKLKDNWMKDINTLTMTDVEYYNDIEDSDKCISWYIQSNIRQVFGNKEGFISIQPVINVYKEKI